MQSFETQISEVIIPAGPVALHGILNVPPRAHGLVLFAHGSGSSRHSSRNQRVAGSLQTIGLATLLFDLLSPEEEPDHAYNARLRFNIDLLADRLREATRWAREQPETAELNVGYFGASTGAAAALVAAATEGQNIGAVVARGARTDLAEKAVRTLSSPTMLIVGGNDHVVASLNLEAWAQLRGKKSIEIIPGAGHLFEEPGAL